MRLKHTLLVQSPGAELSSKVGCLGAKLLIAGVEFLANLIVLNTQTLDVILGMDWLSKHKAVLDCGRRAVTIEDTKGNKRMRSSRIKQN